MKKQLRLVLFAMLVMLLVMTTALVASAATEGATTAEQGHYYSVVGSGDNATPKYYTTLAAAVASLDANGYTIEVLADASSEAWVLNSSYTYTITGGTEGKTVTFTSYDATNKALILVSAGTVTIDNLTVVRGEAITTNPNAVVRVNGVCTLTLNDLVTSAVVVDTLYVNAAATVTVSGAKTDLSGPTGNVVDLRANATLNVTGGKLTGGGDVVFYTHNSKTPTIVVRNAAVVSGEGEDVFGGGTLIKPKITLGTGACVTAMGSVIFNRVNSTGAAITIDGASLYLSGESAKLFQTLTSAPKVPITTNSGTVYLQNGAAVPSEVLDKTSSTNGFDWSKLTLSMAGLSGVCEITEGTYTVASLQAAKDLARQILLGAYELRFPNLQAGGDDLVPFVLNGEGVVLNITGGEYALEKDFFVQVLAGTLNISGGTFTGAANAAILSVQGGTVNLAGGAFTAAEGSKVLDVQSGAVYLSGATLVGGANGFVATLTGGTVYYVSGTYEAGVNGSAFDVQGGTFSVDGSATLLEQHRYMLLASGENATPRYYTTLAKAIAAIDADGYTVTLLANVTEAAWVLNANFTYTLVGAEAGLTVSFSTANADNDSLITIGAGNVTFRNITFAKHADFWQSVRTFIAITGEATLTLHDVTVSASVTDNLYIAAKATVTVSGNTSISGFSGSFANICASDVSVALSGGTFNGMKMFSAVNVQNVSIRIAQAEMTFSGNLLYAENAGVTLQLLEGTTVRASNVLFACTGNSVSVELNGATVYLSGERAVLREAGADAVSINAISGTLHLDESVPKLTTCLGTTTEDWSAIVFYLKNVNLSAELRSECNYVITSQDQLLAMISAQVQANFLAEYSTLFPLAQIVISSEQASPEGLVINHENATVTLSGAFAVNSNVLITLKAGTLNIVSGTYTVNEEAYLVDHQGGTLNITDGYFNGIAGADSCLIRTSGTTQGTAGTISISGGTFKILTVVYAAGKAEITVSGGQFGAAAEGEGSNAFQINHAEANLTISGGTFTDMERGIWAQKGSVSITGGRFYTKSADNARHITVNGAATVTVSGDPEFQLSLDGGTQYCVYVDSGSASATVNIGGGKFGDLNQEFAYAYCVYANGKIGNLNITGGTFYGGVGAESSALMISDAAGGSTVNVSGAATIYAYVNMRLNGAATLNVGGGSFNPHPGSTENVMFKVAGTGAVLNVSGGTFNNYMVAFEVSAAATVNVSGGTFNERTVCGADTDKVEAFAHITAAAGFNMLKGEGGTEAVINMGYSWAVAENTTYEYIGVAFKIGEGAGAKLSFSGGVFNTQLDENLIFDITTGSVSKLTITGGTFHVSGDGAEFLPRALFDVAGNDYVLTGATLHIGKGAYLPIYNYIDAYGLNLVVRGKYYVPNRVMIRTPFAGADPNANGFVVSNMKDVEAMMMAQFASFTVDRAMSCISPYILFAVDHADVVVTLRNFVDSYNVESLVQVFSGTLKVEGGSYTAKAGERIFEILGDSALIITGGSYNVKGAESYMVYIADGVSTDSISISGATIEVAEFGNVPLYATFNISAEKLTVYGMSEILLNEARVYEISSYADLTTILADILAKKFSAAVTVDIKTWVPLRVNNKDAKFVITGGEYNCTMDFMFAIEAGEIEITGGKFYNNAGDIIRVLGPDVKITIDLPNDTQNVMYTAGSIVSAVGAENVNISIAGGRFFEYTRDNTENIKKALFVFGSTDVATNGMVLNITGGSFTATRALYVGKNTDATVTISGGTFTSNHTSSSYSRANTAHMLVLESANARLAISGGSFDNKRGNYIIAQLTEAGSSTVISGGTFNGGCGWFYTDVATTLTVNANDDPTKNPVFKDTSAYGIASCGYIYLNCADASVTVNAGSFTYGNSYEPIFRVQQGTLTVNGGAVKGYVFYITESSDVTINGGDFTASGATATFVNLLGNIGSQLKITASLLVRIENNASFFEADTLSRWSLTGLLFNVKYVVSGNARLSAKVDLTKDETWNTLEDAQHFITDFFGKGIVTFESAGVYSLSLSGNYTITINGGDRTFCGATLLSLSGGADLVIKDGTFAVKDGHIFHVSGAGSNITIGNANDPSACPAFVVNGGSVIYNENVGSNVVIYNGSFAHGEYVGETLKSVISVENPLFYFGECATKSSLTIHNGTYEATSILTDAKGLVDTTIHNGTFKSNYIAANMSSAHYNTDGKTPLIDKPYSLFYFNGANRTLTVNGGSFDGGLGYAIFGLFETGGENTWTLAGGTFNGGYYWIRAEQALTLNIKNQYGEEGDLIAKPTFTDGKGYTYRGFDLPASTALNIEGGKFTIRDGENHHMFFFSGAVTANVKGGEFQINSGNRYDDDQQLQNDSLIFYMNAKSAKLYISGGTFAGARLIYESKGSTTIEISGGTFTSNAISYDDAHIIRIGGNSTVLTITGGTFTGNTYTATMVVISGSGTAKITVNVLGGTFNMGLRWIASSRKGLVLNVGKEGTAGPRFLGLSSGRGSNMVDGKKEDLEKQNNTGFYASATDQTFNFYSCNIKLESDQQQAVFYRVYAQMIFHPGVVVEAPGVMFQINSISGSLDIHGGTYTCYNGGQMIVIKASPKQECNIVINDGTFTSNGVGELFSIVTSKNINLTVKGGTFHATEARMIRIADMGINFVIEGGAFSTTGTSIIELESNTVPFIVRGGTFTMLENEAINSEAAVINAVGKQPSVIHIEGGMFFDRRTNGRQMIFKYNTRAVINISGNFKMYSMELREYFLYDYDDPSGSIVMSSSTPEELYNNEYYYTCFGYYNRYAPVINKAPGLYAKLGGEGILFTASVSAEVAQYLATLGTVSYGTLVFPTEFLMDGWQNGTDFLAELQAYADNTGRSYSSVYAIINAVNGLTTEADGSLTIRAALVNIKEKNYGRSFTGIAFAKVTDASGNETYYYASHVSAGVSGEMRTIAKNALNDLQSKPGDNNGRVYCYASIMQRNKFSRYTTVFQDSLGKYLPEKDRKPKF